MTETGPRSSTSRSKKTATKAFSEVPPRVWVLLRKARTQRVLKQDNTGSDANRYEHIFERFRFNNNEQMAILGNANNINLNTFTSNT